MRTFQKLVRNGNSTQITITKAFMEHLGWLPGGMVTIDVTEEKTLVVERFDPHAINPRNTRPKRLGDSEARP